MITFICLFFPPVIAVQLHEWLEKKELPKKQWGYYYTTAVLFVNLMCFLVKRLVLGTGTLPIFDLYTDITPSVASNYLIMAIPFSICYSLGIYGIQHYVKQHIHIRKICFFVKQLFAERCVPKVAGICLGIASCLVFYYHFEMLVQGILFLALFIVAGFSNIKVGQRPFQYGLLAVWTIVVVAVLVLFPYYELCPDTMWERIEAYTPISAIILNTVLVFALIAFINVFTVRWRVSVAAVAVFLWALTALNGYIYRFRGKEFIFPDIFAAKTAINVAGQYDLSMQYPTFLVLVVLLLLLLVSFSFPKIQLKQKRYGRVASLAVGAVLFLAFQFVSKDIPIITWTKDGTLMNGYYMNFYISIRDYFVEKPALYSDKQIQELEEKYGNSEIAQPDKKPHIVVIMNESFADLEVLGSKIRADQEVMPFWDSLSENTVKGYALTSVFGGTTANAEFEFLTGFSTHMLPSGATPYQQYIYEDTYSLAWLLNSYGYRSMATHPFRKSGWNRPVVYPRLGFQESTFQDAYPRENLIRAYVSDQEMYEYVLQQLENNQDDPLFLFGITMQNHGGYSLDEENFNQTIFLEGYDEPYPQAEAYLSLMNQSDQALEYFFTELDRFPEDTIVLIFGDHLPNVEEAFLEELHGGSFTSLDSQMKRFMVPFAIWANFDIEEQVVECTSLNYLARYLLEYAGLELPPYYQFLKEMESEIPALNAMGYYTSREETCFAVGDTQPEAEWIEKYKVLQYNGLFDKKKTSSVFFGNYVG